MLESSDERKRPRIVGPAFDADDTLADRRQARAQIQVRGDARLQSEAKEPGAGQHDRIQFAVVEALDAAAYVAAQRFYLEIRAGGEDLRLAAQAGGAYARARR